MTDQPPTPISDDALRVLAGWAPLLAAPGLDFGKWADTTPNADGSIQMPWFEYSDEARRFMSDVAAAGFVQPLDWMTWASSPAGQAYITDHGRVASADRDDLRRLLTAIIRGDRFTEGNVAGAFESGMLLAIARRAEALVA